MGFGDLDQQRQGWGKGQWGRGLARWRSTIPVHVPRGSDKEKLVSQSCELASGNDASLQSLLPKHACIYHEGPLGEVLGAAGALMWGGGAGTAVWHR